MLHFWVINLGMKSHHTFRLTKADSITHSQERFFLLSPTQAEENPCVQHALEHVKHLLKSILCHSRISTYMQAAQQFQYIPVIYYNPFLFIIFILLLSIPLCLVSAYIMDRQTQHFIKGV